ITDDADDLAPGGSIVVDPDVAAEGAFARKVAIGEDAVDERDRMGARIVGVAYCTPLYERDIQNPELAGTDGEISRHGRRSAQGIRAALDTELTPLGGERNRVRNTSGFDACGVFEPGGDGLEKSDLAGGLAISDATQRDRRNQDVLGVEAEI